MSTESFKTYADLRKDPRFAEIIADYDRVSAQRDEALTECERLENLHSMADTGWIVSQRALRLAFDRENELIGLLDDVIRYAQHNFGCPMRIAAEEKPRDCNCGFSKLVSRVSARKK